MARRDHRRTTTGAIAASLLVHLALFIVLAHQAAPVFRTPAETSPDFNLQLVSEPTAPPVPQRVVQLPPHPSARTHPQPQPTPRAAARAIQAPLRPPTPRVQRAPSAPLSRTTANVPAPGAATPSSQTGGSQATGAKGASGRWTVQGEDDQDGVRKFLRATVGCSHQDYLRLTEPERTACDRRIGEDARALRIPADKLAGFLAAAEAQERTRGGRTGPLPDMVVPCKGVGANLDRGCLNLPGHPPDD